MRVTFTVVEGPHQGAVFTFSGHDTFLFGRSKKAHFQLKDKYFSRIHFMVEINPPYCRLIDMNSRNKTYLNNAEVTTADLRHGDRIKAGHTILYVAVEDAATTPPDPVTAPTTADRSGPVPMFPPVVQAAPAQPAWVQPIPIQSVPRQPVPVQPVPVAVPAPSRPPASRPPVVLVAPRPPAPEPARPVVSVVRQQPPPPVCRACGTAVYLTMPAAAPALCPECEDSCRKQAQTVPNHRLVREVGRGGMGVVYLALRLADLMPVALKTITPAGVNSKPNVERFLREAAILRELQHLHVVRFHEMGETSGMLYFTMEFVPGTDAGRLLRASGRLATPRAVTLACQVLDALEYAHSRRFVHRDIKPANILVTQEGGREVTKLTDFGLARVYQSSALSGLTLAGEVGGTMAFMAPEQITNFREVQPPVDQYAAAATLYNLLTDRYVYDLPAKYQAGLVMILHDDPVPIRDRRPDVPQGLADIIHKALAREPEDRFADVRAMRAALLPYC